jgi:uncharacterized protein YdhG (YjbR/CyaY superfamily)
MNPNILEYNNLQNETDREICNQLSDIISENLPDAENKIWHKHPVWFLDGNPIVGYSKLKDGIRLMFWSGMSFGENELKQGTGKFKDASKTYTSINEISTDDLKRWLKKSIEIQWDYKNIVKRKGKLEPIKGIV